MGGFDIVIYKKEKIFKLKKQNWKKIKIKLRETKPKKLIKSKIDFYWQLAAIFFFCHTPNIYLSISFEKNYLFDNSNLSISCILEMNVNHYPYPVIHAPFLLPPPHIINTYTYHYKSGFLFSSFQLNRTLTYIFTIHLLKSM